MKTTQKESENYILELIKTVIPYKWSIAIITLLAVLLTKFYLYFVPPTYQSSAIVKVKVHKEEKTKDFLRDSINNTSTVGIKQEVLSLQTFKLNKEALEKVDFSVQYFQRKDYRMVELYHNIPIALKVTKTYRLKDPYKKLIITDKGDKFTLTTDKNESSELYSFNSEVKTPYFLGTVTKKDAFPEPIQLVLNGDKRNIYQSIIKKRLYVEQVDLEANLIRVFFQDTIPDRADAYVNALLASYMRESLYNKDKTNNRILTFLERQLKNIKAKLEASEEKLEKYKSQNIIEPSIKVKDSFDKLSAIDLDLSALSLKEKLAKNLMTFVKNNRNLDAIGPTLLEFKDEATIKFINTLEELQQQEEELSIEFTDQYPKLRSIKKRIRLIKKKIIRNIKNLESTLISKRKTLESQKKKYETVLKELPKDEKELVAFQRDYEVNSKMYSYLLEKKAENELIKVASVSNYEIIDSAYTPFKPIKPKQLIVLITAAILGFLFALFVSLFRVFFIDKVATGTDIQLMTRLPIYGIIPLYNNLNLSTSRLKEAYHKLATNLQFSKKENIGSIILFSSHGKGEGKTTTVVNVAGVFQNSGYKTIVLDLNLREPSIHSHFGIEQQYSGISTYLNQRDNIGNIIFSTNFENLDIIPAGPVPPNPSELILSKRLTDLFEFLQERYEYIIVDTTAYTVALETLYLMQFSTTNLIVIREKMSKKSAIVELEKLIQEKNLQNMGLVLQSIVKEPKNGQSSLLKSISNSSMVRKSTKVPPQLSL